MSAIKNKIICITGATSGIGEACAIACAKAGAKLLLIGRRQQRLDQVAATCQQQGAAAIKCLAIDVRDNQAVVESLSALGEDWQAIDILVNNAGLSLTLDHLDEADIADWDQMIDTNVKGLLYFIRCLLPGMKQRNRGQIINIGSVSGYLTYPGGSVYCSTKFAVRAITQSLRQELLGTPIRVNLVNPGATNTEFSQVRFKGDQGRADAVYQGMQPLTAKDVAESILFCMHQPLHVNIDEILVMPLAQAAGAPVMYRQE